MSKNKTDRLIKRANKLLRKGKINRSIKLLEDAIIEEPNNIVLLINLGILYQNNNQHEKAERAYRSAETSSSDDPNLNWQVGEFLFGANQANEALPYLQYSVQQWPDNSQVLALLGKTYLQLKRFEDAEDALERALKLDASNPDSRDGMVDLYMETEREHLIRELLANYLANAPKIASSHVFMADFTYYEEGDCQGSLPYYERGLLLSHNRKMAQWYTRHFSTREFPQSIAYSYSNALLDCGYHEEAKRVARENLEGAIALRWKANFEVRSQNLNNAIELIKKTIEVEPHQHTWQYTLGLYYLLAGQPKQAELEIRAALKLAGEDYNEVWYWTALIIALKVQKKINEAQNIKKRIVSKENEAYFLNSLARHYYELENWEEVLEVSQRFLQAYARDRHVLPYMARALVKLGKYNEGIQTFEESLKFQPRNGRILIELCEAYLKSGEFSKAISTLEHGISSDILSKPQEKEVRRIHARVKNEMNS